MANYKNDRISNITLKRLELINDINLLFALCFVTNECSKNNALLLSVISNAKSLSKTDDFIVKFR